MSEREPEQATDGAKPALDVELQALKEQIYKYQEELRRRKNSSDLWGRAVFYFLIVSTACAVLATLWVLGNTHDLSRQITSTTVTKGPNNSETIITTYLTSTLPTTTTLHLGAFDPGLGRVQGYAIGFVIVLIGATIEIALLLVYGAFYIHDRRPGTNNLGLPKGLVRVFLLLIVSLAILTFAFLPSVWGDNRAVAFLLGLFSTVVGFYYGSNRDSRRGSRYVIRRPKPTGDRSKGTKQ